MASRRQARQYALQALYASDLRGIEATSSLNALWVGLMDGEGVGQVRPPESAEVEFATRLVEGTLANKQAIDELIESCSTKWRIPRMPIVDRNILRMSAYEFMHCDDIPATVTVNEAVELAKLFGTADSRAFVNGVVDRMGRQLNRLEGRR